VVSVVGKPESHALWESAIVGCLMAWFVFFRITRPESLLLGAFIYIKRPVYDAIGGYGNVWKAIQEDTALARALADYGVQPLTFLWPGAYRLRMYSTWRQAFHGLTRVFVGDFRFKRVAGTTAVIGISSILPLLCIAFLLAATPLRDNRSIALLALSVLATLAQFAFYIRVLVRLGVSPWVALTKPFGDAVLFIAAVNAAAKAATGGKVTWRDRRYSKESVSGANEGVLAPTAVSIPRLLAGPGGERLSVVLSVTAESDPGTVERFLAMARYADAEVVMVRGAGVQIPAAASPNLKIVETDGTAPFEFERRGFLNSTGSMVAFAGWEGDYGPDWMQAVLKAFESQEAHIVVGNTRYEGETALPQAGWMRDWAQLKGLNKPVPRIASCNFAARREILERYQFGHDLHGHGAVLLLATQVAMDGVGVTYSPDMVCRLKNPYERWDTAWRHLRSEHRLAREIYARGIASMDFAPFGSRLFARLLPLTVAIRLAVLIGKNYSRLCSEIGLGGRARGDVFLRLSALAVIDYHVALFDVMAGGPRVPGVSERERHGDDAVQRALFRVVVFYGREYNHDY
jgi:hypothetical protein